MALKTIKSVTLIPGHTHEAVGALNKVEFTDGTSAKMYEESFFQIKEYSQYLDEHDFWDGDYNEEDHMKTLIGKKLDLEECHTYTPA